MSLFSVSIDPDNFEIKEELLAEEVASHRQVIEICAKYGVLVHGGEDFKQSKFFENLIKAKPAIKQIWMAGLPYLRKLKSKNKWDGTYPNNTIDEFFEFSTDIDVILPDDIKNEIIFSVDKGVISRVIPELNDAEVGWFKLMHYFDLVQKTISSTDDMVKCGEVIKGVLRRKLIKRINCNGNFVIFDRYLIDNSIEAYSNGSRCFFQNVFDLIGATSIHGVSVDIITEESRKHQVADFLAHLNQCKNSKIKNINIHLLKNNEMKLEGHHRYIRVNRDIIGFDSGLGIFCGDLVLKDSVCWYKSYQDSESIINNETSIKKYSSHHKI